MASKQQTTVSFDTTRKNVWTNSRLPKAAMDRLKPLLNTLQVRIDARDFDRLVEWMSDDATLSAMHDILVALELDPAMARTVLAILMLSKDPVALGDEEHDTIMRLEATRFDSALSALCDADSAAGALDAPRAAGLRSPLKRAVRFYSAWRRVDRPSLLDALMGAIVADGVRQREEGASDPVPSEALMRSVAQLGGEEAKSEARRRFRVQWARVEGRDLLQSVIGIAEDAFWDSLRDKISHGEYEALYSILGELHEAMCALVSHSSRALDDVNDKFDVNWIRQRVQNGALSVPDVHALMDFVMHTIVTWQAPADVPSTASWVKSARHRSASHSLNEVVLVDLLPFLREAIKHLKHLYERIVALSEMERTTPSSS